MAIMPAGLGLPGAPHIDTCLMAVDSSRVELERLEVNPRDLRRLIGKVAELVDYW